MLKTPRFPDWPERLAAHITKRSDIPFSWGTNDCATFAADAVFAITGVDPIVDIRGTWKTLAEAGRALSAEGGLGGYLGKRFPQLPGPLFAQRGDLGLVALGIGEAPREAAAICLGPYWAAPGIENMLMVPLGNASVAWAVGREV